MTDDDANIKGPSRTRPSYMNTPLSMHLSIYRIIYHLTSLVSPVTLTYHPLMPLQLRFSVPSPSPNHSSTFRLPSTSRSRRRFTLLVLFACFALLISLSILILQTASHANAQVDNLLSSSKKRIKGWSDDWSTWRVGKEDTIGNEEAWLESIGDVVASHEDDMVVGNIEESCHGWDPEADEKDDPVDCLRSRQYRQVQRVLAREEKAEQYVHLSGCTSRL